MNQQQKSQNRDSQDSACSKASQSYQIQPFEIESHTLTHRKITKMIQMWDTFDRIKEKFGIWSLNFQHQKVLRIVPQQFYRTAIHYVFLKKLSILIKDYDESKLLQKSLQLKQIYKIQSLKGKLKGRKFDYLLIVTVKLIGFFFGSHTRQIIINPELQAQIYAILVFVLLGAQVGERTFVVLMQKYKKKPSLKYNRSSQIFMHLPYEKKVSEHNKETKKSTAYSKKRIGRTVCRTGTELFQETSTNYQDYHFREMKQLLKANLLVKEFVPKPMPKQNLDEVLSKTVNTDIKLQQLREAKNMQLKDIKHKKIFYTQMSSSLDLKRNNESLNSLHNHSLKIKPEKRSKYYQFMSKADLKTRIIDSRQNSENKLPKIQQTKEPEVYSYQAMVVKKKQPTYWKKIISEMKENHYQNIQHFPPINAKMYFKQEELDDEAKKLKILQNSEVITVQNQNQYLSDDNYHGEYITQKVVQMPTTKDSLKSSNKYPKSSLQLTSKKTSLRTKTILEQLKSQINIIEYSKVANQGEIYKSQKGFMNVYSNQPSNDANSRLKKKSFHQLKEIQKQFYQDCKVRHEKIQQSYFS